MKAGVVLVAAGLGTRLGAGIPKALVELTGEPLVVHAVRRLLAAGGVSHVVVVAPVGHQRHFVDLLERSGLAQGFALDVVEGGLERSDSVRCGLRALDRECDVVLVHDAARALSPTVLVERVLNAVEAGADAVVPVVPVTDTIKVVAPLNSTTAGLKEIPDVAQVVSTPSRSSLRAVQTPQGFRRSSLVAAHESGRDATDDAALVELIGGEVVVVPGEELALKVTTPIDLVIAEHLLKDPDEANPS